VVKAVYLLNFGRFATWPPIADVTNPTSFTVCVLGSDPLGPTLDSTVKGETINGRRVVVKRWETLPNQSGCRILFIGSTEGARLNELLPVLTREAVLTVSDMPRFTERGGMIQFVLEGNKVRFRVNAAAVDQAGLALSSELLRVATSVTRPVTQ